MTKHLPPKSKLHRGQVRVHIEGRAVRSWYSHADVVLLIARGSVRGIAAVMAERAMPRGREPTAQCERAARQS